MSHKAAILVLASWFSVISCQDRGAYYDNTHRTWQQSSTNCQLLGAWDEGRFSIAGLRVPTRPPGVRPDQFYWIGARVQQTPWFSHLGCFETPTASVQRDISNETDPTFTCYLFCASFKSYITMGISRKTCYCYDDVHKHRKPQEQCFYETFPNNQDELYGAPNPGSVIVFTYHTQRPISYSNDFGNCASFRYLGSLPVTHQYSSCLNRLGIFCTNGQTQAVEIPWTEAVKRCGTLKTDLTGYYTGLTDLIKYRPLWTGFYRRSIEKWTPPNKSETYGGVNLHSYHCVAVKVNDDGTIFPITYPQLCSKTLPSLCERSTAVDGNWASWSAWSSCPVTCGGGIQERKRSCTNPPPKHGGRVCVGEATETQTCNALPCPVDGNWAQWSDYGDCSNTCGHGQQSRTRTCTSPKPEHGGKLCEGDSTEKQACIGCPANKRVTEWTIWNACSTSCGTGSQSRLRKCDLTDDESNAHNCRFSENESRSCNSRPCPIDGKWSSWASWGKCSEDCGKGKQLRRRECNNPAPEHGGKDCPGDVAQEKDCIGCPQQTRTTESIRGGIKCHEGISIPYRPGHDGINGEICSQFIQRGLSPWTTWSACSVTCGDGIQARNRQCDLTDSEKDKEQCYYKEEERKNCQTNRPCPIDGFWSSWTKWSDCCVNSRSRSRTCDNPKPEHGGANCVGNGEEIGSCFGCPGGKPDPIWTPWDTCPVTCGGGVTRRSRSCILTPDESIRYKCFKRESQMQSCSVQPCPVDGGWSKWSSWSGCSNSCGHGQDTRTRTCTNPKPENGGKQCTGDGSQTRNCIGCPEGKLVTGWSAWDQCSVTCGSGVQKRYRDCGLTDDEANKHQCYFKDTNSQSCNGPPCPTWSPWTRWGDCCVSNRARYRRCDNPLPGTGGIGCEGSGIEYENCFGCPGGKPDPTWTSWSICSVTCGRGRAYRILFCNLTPTEAIRYNCFRKVVQEKLCSEKACPVDGGWSLWSAWGGCSNTCGHGQNTRERSCTNPKPENGGISCIGDKSETKNCFGCPGGKVVTNWSTWGQCSVSCGNGVQKRSRDCGLTSDEADRYQCYYRDKESQTCSKQPCPPINGNWSPWSSWGTCSVTCGEGIKSRTRACNNPPASNGGTSCPGQSQETSKCTEKPCSGVGVCVKSCMNVPDGYYQSCDSCSKYVTCSNGNIYVRNCPGVLVWDDVAKRCLHSSTTCSMPNPLSSESSRMKRSVDLSLKRSSLVRHFQGYNWTIMVSSAVGGVAIVALIAVAIKLVLKKKLSKTQE